MIISHLLQGNLTSEKLTRCGFPDGMGMTGNLDYLEGYGDPSISSNVVPSAEEIEGSFVQLPVDIIGWTSIRDVVYVFATTNNSFNPGGVLDGNAQLKLAMGTYID